MKNSYMTFSINKDQHIRATNYDALISYIKNSNEFWYIKDHESKFVYINDYGLYYTELPKYFIL